MSGASMIEPHFRSVTTLHVYEGVCVNGPLDGETLRSTETIHRISVPAHRVEGQYFTQTYKLAEYHFVNGQWEYRG